MAQQIQNTSQNPYVIPPDYGGGQLAPGAAIVVLDTLQNANNLFGSVNPGVSTDPLVMTQAPDSTAGAISPGAITPLTGASPGLWAGSVPTNSSAAINRLASAVYALRGNVPIP